MLAEYGASRTLMANHIVLTVIVHRVSWVRPRMRRSIIAMTNGATAVATRWSGVSPSNGVTYHTTQV